MIFDLNFDSESIQIIIFLLGFGPGQLTQLQSIYSYVAGFYKLTILKVYPPIFRITAHAYGTRLLTN
jgi:hypothetical protein